MSVFSKRMRLRGGRASDSPARRNGKWLRPPRRSWVALPILCSRRGKPCIPRWQRLDRPPSRSGNSTATSGSGLPAPTWAILAIVRRRVPWGNTTANSCATSCAPRRIVRDPLEPYSPDLPQLFPPDAGGSSAESGSRIDQPNVGNSDHWHWADCHWSHCHCSHCHCSHSALGRSALGRSSLVRPVAQLPLRLAKKRRMVGRHRFAA
jgi:hypothetical protein